MTQLKLAVGVKERDSLTPELAVQEAFLRKEILGKTVDELIGLDADPKVKTVDVIADKVCLVAAPLAVAMLRMGKLAIADFDPKTVTDAITVMPWVNAYDDPESGDLQDIVESYVDAGGDVVDDMVIGMLMKHSLGAAQTLADDIELQYRYTGGDSEAMIARLNNVTAEDLYISQRLNAVSAATDIGHARW